MDDKNKLSTNVDALNNNGNANFGTNKGAYSNLENSKRARNYTLTYSVIGVLIYLLIGYCAISYLNNKGYGPGESTFWLFMIIIAIPVLFVLGLTNFILIRQYTKQYKPKGLKMALAIFFLLPSIICVLGPLILIVMNFISLLTLHK